MKTHISLKISLFFILSAIILITITMISESASLSLYGQQNESVYVNETKKYKTVIIDAGHGGEDGGAVSSNGLVEKNINLEIAIILSDMLKANGVDVIMTRNDDRLLYDRNVDYKGRKKKLDLAARLSIANSIPDAIFISIHMNSFTDPRYSGLQVWYSVNDPNSKALAELIRAKNKEKLQPDNYREIKAATSAINLLYNAKCPSVLVECGFLSNSEEAALFESHDYRKKIAFILFCSLNEYLNKVSNNPN